MKRIGLTQRVDIVADYQERRDALDQRWTHLLKAAGLLAVPLPNAIDDVSQYLSALSLSGVILTGGNDIGSDDGIPGEAPERDRLEHILLDECATADLPVLAVCRGLQMLNLHYGGALAPVQGHVAKPHPIALAEAVAPLWVGPLSVNSYHSFGITQDGLAPPLHSFAWAPDGTVEAAQHRQFRQTGIMWHPERASGITEFTFQLLRSLFIEERR